MTLSATGFIKMAQLRSFDTLYLIGQTISLHHSHLSVIPD